MPFPFADGLGGPGTIVIGLLILVTAFLLRRTGLRSRKTRDGDVVAEVKQDFLQREERNLVDRQTVKLHDFARDVDALTQTRIALLRELTAEADRAIIELQTQLAACGISGEFTPAQRRIAVLLSKAGHPTATIANLLNRPESEIRAALQEAAEKPESNAA